MDINAKIASELGIRKEQVEATVRLIDEGNTIPFIARYRKEATGALNDEVLRNLFERLNYLRGLEERRETILASIEEQGKLTDELKKDIMAAETMVVLEDLYRPYKPKRRTRATIAREKGLDVLADILRAQEFAGDLTAEAEKYISEEKEVKTAEDALSGARDIIAEEISDAADYRAHIRELTYEQGVIVTSAHNKEEESVYEMYYDYREAVNKLPGHRVLAINRGEKEKVLSVKLETPVDEIIGYLKSQIVKDETSPCGSQVYEAIKDSYTRLIAPSIEREIRNDLTDEAEDGAIKVFGKNLEQLLMQPPIEGQVVLGWDPAFRTGCKLAVVDPTGKVLDTTVIFPTAPQNNVEEAKLVVKRLIDKYGVNLISVGNGTASRESEQIIVDILKEVPVPVQYVIVNEAGASVYSASKLATEEFPEFDVGQRSATSIARRLQDPLAELVKIEPQSIGVGQYQHDMNQKKLSEALSGVVEDSVNRVGVDLNTASVPLLTYVSGITKPIAKNIVSYREKHGRFDTRTDLLKVAKLGPKAYEQSAGFLRIRGGDEPLDATGVHPESYKATMELLELLGRKEEDLKEGGLKGVAKEVATKYADIAELAGKLGIGIPTLEDIIKELEKPGRDPREDMPSPILRHDVMELSDLKTGMVLKGTVRNIVDFGAFVDIGVHQDGLVHISHMTEKFIKHPLEVVKVGDIVDVEVIGVDLTHQRIALSMRIGYGDVAGENGKHEMQEGGPQGRKPSGKGKPGGKKNDNKKRSDGGKERVGNSTFGSSMADLFKDIKLN